MAAPTAPPSAPELADATLLPDAAPIAAAPAAPPSAASPSAATTSALRAAVAAAHACARVDPRDFMREPDYVPTTAVEDIYRRWDSLVPAELREPLETWVHELVRRAPGAHARADARSHGAGMQAQGPECAAALRARRHGA